MREQLSRLNACFDVFGFFCCFFSADVIYYKYKVPEGERHDTAVKRNKEALKAELKLWEGYLQKVNLKSIKHHTLKRTRQKMQNCSGRLLIWSDTCSGFELTLQLHVGCKGCWSVRLEQRFGRYTYSVSFWKSDEKIDITLMSVR